MEVIGKHPGMNKGELKVLNWLEKGLASSDGVILVEPPMSRAGKHPFWPDFVIVSPTHGICILECKSFESARIRSIGSVEELKTHDEVIRYKLQLRNYRFLMRRLLGDEHFQINSAVIFPLIAEAEPVASELYDFNSDTKDLNILFRDHMNWDASLDLLIGEPFYRKLNSKEFKAIFRLINPIRIFDQNFTLDLESLHQDLKIFDDEQMRIIEGIKEGHYIINGLPGTGKTKMLEAIAQREMAQGKNVLVTCFNRMLLDTISEVVGSEIAVTLAKLYYPYAKSLGYTVNDRDWLEKAKSELMEMKLEAIYDVLLVDEYQDLDEGDYAILLKLLKPEGLLVLAGDQLQNVRGSKETWKSKGVDVSGGRHRNFFLPKPYRTQQVIVDFALKFICRNESLKKIAQRYFKDHHYEHSYGEMKRLTDVVKFMPAWKEGTRFEIEDIIRLNPKSKILVITCSHYQVSELNLKPSANVMVAPFTTVKGIEADIVILYNVDYFIKWNPEIGVEEKMKMLFSALCRSRGLLYINGFSSEGFYDELHELYLDCLTNVQKRDIA